MWATITSRKHTIYKIFSFGPQSKEFMLYGHVKHTPETGKDIEKEWAGRVELAEDANGELKFKFYQVYVVRVARSEAAPIVFLSLTDTLSGYRCPGFIDDLTKSFQDSCPAKVASRGPTSPPAAMHLPVINTFERIEVVEQRACSPAEARILHLRAVGRTLDATYKKNLMILFFDPA